MKTLFTLGLLILLTTQAQGRMQVCGDRTKMVKMLVEKYKEQPKAIGVSTSGRAVLEIFSDENGKWTALMTSSRRMACIVGAGHSWQDMKQVFAKET